MPKVRLIWKLIGINLLSVGIVILMVWQVIDYFAADYFMALMKEYKIDPKILHQAFLHTTHQFLLLAMGLGVGTVTVFSFLITRKLLHALTQMTRITRKLATGDYAERVEVVTGDEVGELGTAFNQMASSLQMIEQLRKTLVANVAHELRTPLNNLRGQLEAMQDSLMSPSPNAVRSLHEEVMRLVRLVEALHRLSQVEADTHWLKKESLELSALIAVVVQKEKSALDKRKITLKVDALPVSVQAHADCLIQVIGNLIQNILQYTPEGGEASISMVVQDGSVHVTFTNSGQGIDPIDLPHIFERFFRGEKSRSRELGGAGIGLAIVKEIVVAHGGYVEAKSRPGETAIGFVLPGV